MSDARERLELLARLHDVELSYHDIVGQEHVASNQTLVRVLGALGVRADTPDLIDEAILARRQALARQVLDPVLTFWEGKPPCFVIRVPQALLAARYRLELVLEQQASNLLQDGVLSTLRRIESFEVEGSAFHDLEARLFERIPFGYHRLRLSIQDQTHEALVISAPLKAYLPDQERMWGFFAPTYALRTHRGSGAGGFAELSRLIEFTQASGGQVVATLPLMAAFLDQPFEPSPYVPVSRLFWNEMFLDLQKLARQQSSEAARIALADPDFLDEAARLRSAPHVDYLAQARLHRSVLEILAREAVREGSEPRSELDAWANQHPMARDYARFRAVTEARRTAWQEWPERLRDGNVEPGDYEASSYFYHLYAQWRLEQQLGDLGQRARAAGGGLYLDLPLGVHPSGYDAWRFRSAFLDRFSAGAPPDELGPDGQDWGFRPLHPELIRTTRYQYFIECIQTQVRHAGILRIDHVMGLHRIFCVPWNGTGADGVYVRYRADELWAIVALESRRHGAMIVGEDLGTVPNEVRRAMSTHDIQRMYVLQFELGTNRSKPINDVPGNAVATVNTHDTPTFAGFWKSRDIDDRLGLGWLPEAGAQSAYASRDQIKEALSGFLRDQGLVQEAPSLDRVFKGVVEHLAQGPARLVLLTLEDLWLEPEPQNVPGTSIERKNWQRRLSPNLDDISSMSSVGDVIEVLAQARNGAPGLGN